MHVFEAITLALVDNPRFGGFSYAMQNDVMYWFPVEITHQDGNQVTIRYLDTGNTHTRNVNDRSHFIPASVPPADQQTIQLGVAERHLPLIDDPHFGGFAKYGNNSWYPVEIISQDGDRVNVRYLDDRSTTNTFGVNDRDHFIPASVSPASEKALEIRNRLIQNLLQNGDNDSALHYCQMFIKSGTFTIIEPLLYNFYQTGVDPYLLHNALQDIDPEWLIKAISHAAQNRESEFVIYMARCFPETMPDFVNENPRVVAQLIKAGMDTDSLSLLTNNKINNNDYFEKIRDFARYSNDGSCLLKMYIQFPQHDFPPDLMAEMTEYLLTSENSGKEKTYTKIAEAITARDLPEASTGWADLYCAIWEMSEYSKKIENKAPEAARDFKEFALTLLKKTNTYHMTAENDKNYSAFETDLKQSIEKKVASFRHRHFSWFKTFAVFLGNVLAALTVVGAIYMIAKKQAIVHMPATTREKKTQDVITAAQKIGHTMYKHKEQEDKYSYEEKYSHNEVPHTDASDRKGKRRNSWPK